LSIHGPSGVVDLVVPQDAAALDLAREYAAVAGLSSVPPLVTRTGRPLAADEMLSDAGIGAGDILVAAGPVPPPERSSSRRARAAVGVAAEPGALSGLWVATASVAAVLAAWLGAQSDGTTRSAVIVALVVAALTGLVPAGRLAPRRAVTAPAFAAAAAFVQAWSPEPERLPTVLGVSGLVAAVAAAMVRAVDKRAEESLKVWIASGVGLFLLSTGAALAGFEPQVVWGSLLVIGMLAARLVPAYAIDVPDHYLLELDRLSVSAWSARTQPKGRRNRTIVPEAAVAMVAEQGARLLLAGTVAVFVVTLAAAPLLLASATLPVDSGGARALVLFVGAALVLAARSYRYAAPRALLRLAGLVCWTALLWGAVDEMRPGLTFGLAAAAVAVAALLVVAAVATGRGWRSVWWSRRAEVAEGLCGAGAFAALVVAVGLVRNLWESGISV
jgi:hypothetical protein